jgi:hypothetical protein
VGNGGTGTLTVDAASIDITANAFGGGFTIGTTDGVGTATFENGASVVIHGSTGGNGFNIGTGNGTAQGTLNITSGATLTLDSTSASGGMTIGNAGIGTVTVSGNGTTVLQNGLTTAATPSNTVGSQGGSNGTLTIKDGATWTFNRSCVDGSCSSGERLRMGVMLGSPAAPDDAPAPAPRPTPFMLTTLHELIARVRGDWIYGVLEMSRVIQNVPLVVIENSPPRG